MGMENFQLAILFTAAGATVGAGLVKIVVSALKGFGWVPETGRGVLYAVAAASLLLIILAAIDADWLRDGISGADVLMLILSYFNLYAASIGVHETAVKVTAIARGTTNPAGPDERAG